MATTNNERTADRNEVNNAGADTVIPIRTALVGDFNATPCPAMLRLRSRRPRRVRWADHAHPRSTGFPHYAHRSITCSPPIPCALRHAGSVSDGIGSLSADLRYLTALKAQAENIATAGANPRTQVTLM